MQEGLAFESISTATFESSSTRLIDPARTVVAFMDTWLATQAFATGSGSMTRVFKLPNLKAPAVFTLHGEKYFYKSDES